MRVSCRWLRELCPALDASDGDLADRLTNAGLEVEHVEHRGGGLDGVVIARVDAVEPHPSRDQLRLVTVCFGEGRSQRVVCGASNVPDPGGHVVLATEGTIMPALGVPLAPRKIGGVESSGMLCSETELGLAEASEGILIVTAFVLSSANCFSSNSSFIHGKASLVVLE
jgi:phenylalanyl-tRNA synthetase beta chain